MIVDSTKPFRSRLDRNWQTQDIIHDFSARSQGTGSRSDVGNVNKSVTVLRRRTQACACRPTSTMSIHLRLYDCERDLLVIAASEAGGPGGGVT